MTTYLWTLMRCCNPLYKTSVGCHRKSVESVTLYNTYPYGCSCLILIGGGTAAEISGVAELSVHA